MPSTSASNAFDKLTPLAKEYFKFIAQGGDGKAPPTADLVPGDATKPATPKEREYWNAFHRRMMWTSSFFLSPEQADRALQNTELFEYPSTGIANPDGTAYTIESRYYRSSATSSNNNKAPLFLHFHGGGLSCLERDIGYELYMCWALREYGNCNVIPCEFRNAREYAFPAGVDDCLATLEWAHASKEMLGFGDTVVLFGASGGGNLAIATYIRAVQKHGHEQARRLVDGIVSAAPFLRGKYVNTHDERFEQRFTPLLPAPSLQSSVDIYTESAADATNPAAWPLLAPDELLQQFPPTKIYGDEFDILGLDAQDFYKRLKDLDVEACSFSIFNRSVHCQSFLPKMVTDREYYLVLSEVAQFANSIDKMKKLNLQ